MTVRSDKIQYTHDGVVFEAVMACDDADETPKPAVLVAHTIRGRTEFEEQKARDWAAHGYVGFAADIYGVDQLGADDDRARSNMNALIENRALLQARMSAALQCLASQPNVDSSRVAATGYCFGGLCVLDLARMAAPVRAVVSFHGLFTAPADSTATSSDVAVLALHGWDDPLATPDAVLDLSREMTALGVDWQIHAYGHTVHAFTNPNANSTERGTVYNERADRRASRSALNFLAEYLDE